MDLWLKFTNVVTVGNMSVVVTLICFGIYGYYKIRRYIALQHAEFLKYVQSLTATQTAHIEACIHTIPGHPENSTPPGNSSDNADNNA